MLLHPPSPPPLHPLPPITSSLLSAVRVRASGSHLAPRPWGLCMSLFVSLSLQSADPAPKTFAARKISLTSEYARSFFSLLVHTAACWSSTWH